MHLLTLAVLLLVPSTFTSPILSRQAASAVQSPMSVSDAVPTPFDTTLGTNWTSTSCPSLFRSLRGSAQVAACVPLSLLLSSSNGFLQAERNATELTRILDRSCTAQSNCTSVMTSVASQLQSASGCAADLKAGNALATKALTGLLAYDVMREVGCLVDPKSKSYCLARAFNSTAATGSAYIYQLASPGVAMPSNSTIACDACLSSSMSVYSRYASNETLALSKAYKASAEALSAACGPSYAPVVASSAVELRFGRLIYSVLAVGLLYGLNG